MNIVVLHQPFPQGNYKLNEKVANVLSDLGHTVYLIEQLNGIPESDKFREEILSVNPDILYFEMLDKESFAAIEGINCKKILLYASRGILPDFTNICEYKGKWFDHILTNSYSLYTHFKQQHLNTSFFHYYFNCIDDLTFSENYNHDCTFLGMGFARLSDPNYHLEQKLFFDGLSGIDFKIYGNGWPTNLPHYRGLLPPHHIGQLYGSAKSAIGIIGSGQRSNGMINNRYSEMMFSKVPILSLKYDTIDWGEADKYINFVNNKDELIQKVIDIKENPSKYTYACEKLRTFINDQSQIFFEQLEDIIQHG